MSELTGKLGLRPGHAIWLLDAPEAGSATIRAACPDGATVNGASSTGQYDAVFFWPATLDGLAERFAALQGQIARDGAVWVVLPKKAFARARGITFSWDEMQAAALMTDLVDNKVVSLTSVEYATRFVLRRERRGRT